MIILNFSFLYIIAYFSWLPLWFFHYDLFVAIWFWYVLKSIYLCLYLSSFGLFELFDLWVCGCMYMCVCMCMYVYACGVFYNQIWKIFIISSNMLGFFSVCFLLLLLSLFLPFSSFVLKFGTPNTCTLGYLLFSC